ncbi:pectinesterase family protein [Paenibacillus filicis]|uniref:Pectinesterase family protein n=1 Tax=Paenibacillus gyeongsangnamensis TaxID=3388067 RepID=A0ABT4QBZ7_9BACL|nr:pectinesterase family protein [Paenibacillus filicis]MCZ8514210.1 pectinesterase family protein [Paenibacillus filicis]
MPKWTVAADGSGEFRTIQAAVDAVRVHQEEPHLLFIKKGVYRERVTIPDNKPNIRLVGESPEETILVSGAYARTAGPDGKAIGTFATPT